MERRPRCRRPVGPQHRNASKRRIGIQIVEDNSMNLAHLAGEFQFEQLRLDFQVQAGAQGVCDPGIALTVDGHSFAAVSASG